MTPGPYIVNLSPEFLAGAPHEAKDLISRSLGLNFGTVAVGEGYGVMPTEPHLTKDLRKVAAEIYAFDIMMQNFDRKSDNPNVLWNRQRIVLIDNESALNPVLQWPDLNLAHLDLDKFYDHVFYSEISPGDADFQRLATALQTLTLAVVDGFIELLPGAWHDEKALSRIKEYLKFPVDNRIPVCDLIRERIFMKSPFSYVVLRYMHDVFTREFVNIAVVVCCPKAGFLQMKGVTRMKRALGLFPGLDRGSVLKTLRFMESRFASYHKSPQQSLRFETLDAASIAKAILPADDSSLQWSPPGGGVTENPAQVLAELFERMVTRHEDKHPAVRRTGEEVWQPFETALQTRDQKILTRLQDKELTAGSFRHRFEHTWQPEGGLLHLLLPLSFDLVDPSNIVDKAIGWTGRIRLLRKSARISGCSC